MVSHVPLRRERLVSPYTDWPFPVQIPRADVPEPLMSLRRLHPKGQLQIWCLRLRMRLPSREQRYSLGMKGSLRCSNRLWRQHTSECNRNRYDPAGMLITNQQPGYHLSLTANTPAEERGQSMISVL